jgi:hypothetical protein
MLWELITIIIHGLIRVAELAKTPVEAIKKDKKHKSSEKKEPVQKN